MVWLWVLAGLVAWFVVGALFALVIGKAIRLADQRSTVGASSRTPARVSVAGTALRDVTPAALPSDARRTRRRALPLPPFAVALAATAVALETVGYVLRLTGSTGQVARLMSMDAPFSVPRMFVAALFAAAALAALAGAGVLPGRRAWWSAVAAVTAAVCAVKAGSTVHATTITALADAIGAVGATLLSAAAAAGVVGSLWVLSRHERRDRRRVLGTLALYAVASVGLSALASAVAGVYGSASTLYAAATYLEESGEALAGVGMLVAVLAGVAPRVVLQGSGALRRAVDPYTLDLPDTRATPVVGDDRP